MKLLTVKLQSDHNIFFAGDQHYGSVLFSNSGWTEFVNCLNSEYDGCSNNFTALGGDNIEAVMIDDKRADAQKMAEPFVLYQIEQVTDMLRPLASKILYMLEGNHESKLWRIGPIVQKIAKDLGVPFGTVTTRLTVRNTRGKLLYKVFDTHGRKGVNSAADDPNRRETNMNLTMKRYARDKACDCAVMIRHHNHKLLVCPPIKKLVLKDNGQRLYQDYTKLDQTSSDIPPDMRWYGCAGTFMKLYEDGYSGYAEVAEYDPTEIGFLVLKVRGGKIVDLKKHYLKMA